MSVVRLGTVYVYPNQRDPHQVITVHVTPQLVIDNDTFHDLHDECRRRGYEATAWDDTSSHCDVIVHTIRDDCRPPDCPSSWQFCEWLMGEFVRIAAVSSANRVHLSRRSGALGI